MSKVTPLPSSSYTPSIFVTADKIVQHFGITAVSALPTAEQARYNDYAASANKQTETVIYKYVDTLPLEITDEANTYAQGMAFYYALWLKSADDGAVNVTSMKEIWESQRDNLVITLQSQPKQATTRTMVSSGFSDTVMPYSQSMSGFD